MLISILRSVAIVVLLYFCSIYSDSQTAQCNGCFFNGECKQHGSRWDDANLCINYLCRHHKRYRGEEKYFVYELLPNSHGCPYNNTCLNFDSSSDNEEECTRYHCYKTSEYTPIMQIFFQGHNLVPRPYGCRYGGQCMENNEEYQDWCSKKRCIVEGNTTEIQSEQIGCYDVGTCHQHDETWNDETCQSKRCNGGRIESNGKGCRDVNGNCHAVGDTGISFYSRATGKTYTCTCMNSHGIMNCRALR